MPVIERMRVRARGHIVLVGSVTAYFGWPTTAAYGGTKAAINILAESLKYDFDKMNVRIQVINPGFVDTPLTEKNLLPMPGLMPVNRASRRMARGLRAGCRQLGGPPADASARCFRASPTRRSAGMRSPRY